MIGIGVATCLSLVCFFLFFKQKTAYEMRISDWSSDVCSSDLFAVQGRDLMTGVPKQILVSYTEVAHCLDKSISKIEEAILKALEITPPELSADIYQTGIYLTGGGALLRGLDKRIQSKTKLPVHIAEDPLRAVVRGTGIALKNIGNFRFLMQ